MLQIAGRTMNFGNVNGLKCKQIQLLIFAFFTIFLLCKWEKSSRYTLSILRPDPLKMFRIQDEQPSSEEYFPVEELPSEKKQLVAAPPPESTQLGPSRITKENRSPLLDRKGCNYAKGRWVSDNRRPLYSGFGCKQWLSESWSCRLTQRTDFEYEKFRWQPEGCTMPEFYGPDFLKRMRHKTIAYVGDSLGRQMFQSMMCMVSEGKDIQDVEDVGADYGLVMEPNAKRPNGWAYRFPTTNTTILYYWSSTLCDLEPLNSSNPSTIVAMHLDRPPAFLALNLHRFDVLVLNTGHHWNRGKLNSNRWKMYVHGAPNADKRIAVIWKAKNFTVHSVVQWLDSQLPRHPRLKVFFRTISPRHFFHGEWNSGGRCDNTVPLLTGKAVVRDRSDDADVEGAVMGTRVNLLDITALSQLRDEGHISRYSISAKAGVQDCLHWCLPGIPDTWNEILAAQLLVLEVGHAD